MPCVDLRVILLVFVNKKQAMNLCRVDLRVLLLVHVCKQNTRLTIFKFNSIIMHSF